MFETDPSFEDLKSWEESLEKMEISEKLKFPISFHDEMDKIKESPDLLSLPLPRKKEKSVKIVDLGKNNKNKKGLF